MIEKFEVGKSYRYSESKRPDGNPLTDWHYGGKMDLVLDGKPHKCIFTDGSRYALFEGQEKYPNETSISWNYGLGFENFEEVTP